LDKESILQYLKSLKLKNTEGYDGIPHRIPIDGSEQLISPPTTLFDMIYTQKKIAGLWKVFKTVLIFKNNEKPRIWFTTGL
jgi:hypothetical protein